MNTPDTKFDAENCSESKATPCCNSSDSSSMQQSQTPYDYKPTQPRENCSEGTVPPTERVTLDVGDELYSLYVTDLLVDGGSIARHEGQAVFLDSGIPGDVVNAQVTLCKKRLVQATVTDIAYQSENRVTPWCKHFSQCGGCSWQHINLAAQREWKQKHVAETLRRLGGVEIPVSPILSGADRAYRNKVAYAFGPGEEVGVIIGLHQRQSNRVLRIHDCGLQAIPVSATLKFLENSLNAEGLSPWQNGAGFLRFLVLHTPEYGDKTQRVAELITGPAGKDVYEKVRRCLQGALDAGGLSGAVHSIRRSRADIAQGEKRICSLGRTEIEESYGSKSLLFPTDGFRQTNTQVATQLFSLVRKLCNKPETLWDLYCGAGVIGLHSGTRAVYGVDTQVRSIDYARKNAERWGLEKAAYSVGKPEAFIESFAAEVLVVDPPRAGLEEAAAKALLQAKASRLIYVSCNVATQARDVARLAPVWKPISAHPVDMFPHTPHVENILILEKKETEL